MRRPLHGSAALAAVALALSACSRSDGADDPVGGSPISVDAAPLLAIGALEGDTLLELHRIVTPFLTADGRVAIPLAASNVIRLFGAADGSYLGALGGPGEGPGEFASLSSAWARGDTIEAFDARRVRITRFLPGGGVETVTPDPAIGIQGMIPGAVADGWISTRVANHDPRPAEEGGPTSPRDDVALDHFARDGTHLGEVTRTRGIARYSAPGFGGPEPLTPRARMAVHGGRVYVGETLAPSVRVLDPDGTIVAELTWEPGEALPVEETVALVIREAVARAEPSAADEVRERHSAAPLPGRLSTWWDFLVDAEGLVWIRPYQPLRHAAPMGGLGPGSYLNGGNAWGGRWIVLSPEGERVAEVVLPGDLSPVQVTRDRLLGIRRDALGVEYVQVHRVVRR